MSAQLAKDTKTVLITGATGGIGRATALAFAERGVYNLALHYNSAPQQTRDELITSIDSVKSSSHSDVKVHFFQADLSSYDSVRNLHASVTAVFQRVDILFNNAGTTGGISAPANLADVPMEVFDATYKVNTGSPILLTQLCLPQMEAQGYGRVIFNSSVAAFTGGRVGPHYASSKSALHGFVHWLAGNVAKKGVTVNGVAPALVQGTSMIPGKAEGEEDSRLAGEFDCSPSLVTTLEVSS